MKKILYLFTICFFAALSCQEPQYVEPDIQRQGITSLTAYFTSTSAQYEDQALATLYVDDPDAEVFEIPIPWFFPEHTTDPTTLHMTRVRVKAELAPNCKIDPPLQILDLTLENKFTFTNALGESRPIIITGKRKKSDKCEIMSFALTKPYRVDGFVNNDTDEIYIFTVDDLKNFSAEATVNTHAAIQTDLTMKKDYNNDQEVTIIAQDEKTTRTYKIVKKYPTKIPYGFRAKSIRQLFNLDVVSFLNFPDYTAEHIFPSLGYVDGSVVVCKGNGETPIYLDALTGVKKGDIALGSAPAAAVTSDEGGNLLLTNHAENGEELMIYSTKSVAQEPTLLHSFKNEAGFPAGYHVKVHGNIDADAVITLTHEGMEGVSLASKYTRVIITEGQVVATETIDLGGLGIGWGVAPGHCAKVVSASNKVDNGIMVSYYSPYNDADIRNSLKYVDGDGVKAAVLPIFEIGSDAQPNYNTNIMDAKTYNNATYAVHLVSSWFANWSCGPQLRVFDITNPLSIKDGKPVVEDTDIKYEAPGGYDQGYSAADVIMAPSADGFKVYIFYFDHNAAIIGGYVADCIDI